MALESPSVYVSIDVAKAHLDVAFGIDAAPRRFPNDAKGVEQIERLLIEAKPVLAITIPSNLNCGEYGAASDDGGATFPNIEFASKTSNPNNEGFGGSFMGDYSGNIFAGESLYALWTDTRSITAQDVVGGLIGSP